MGPLTGQVFESETELVLQMTPQHIAVDVPWPISKRSCERRSDSQPSRRIRVMPATILSGASSVDGRSGSDTDMPAARPAEC